MTVGGPRSAPAREQTIEAIQGENKVAPAPKVQLREGHLVGGLHPRDALLLHPALVATFEFSLRGEAVRRRLHATRSRTPSSSASLFYSFVIGVITIVVSTALIVPTAYWVRLRLPRLRPVVEFVTLMPFVIPAVVLAFGLIRSYSSRRRCPLGNSQRGSDVLLVAAYIVLSFPYMYRAVDTGLRTIDVRSPDRGRPEPRRGNCSGSSGRSSCRTSGSRSCPEPS